MVATFSLISFNRNKNESKMSRSSSLYLDGPSTNKLAIEKWFGFDGKRCILITSNKIRDDAFDE